MNDASHVFTCRIVGRRQYHINQLFTVRTRGLILLLIFDLLLNMVALKSCCQHS